MQALYFILFVDVLQEHRVEKTDCTDNIHVNIQAEDLFGNLDLLSQISAGVSGNSCLKNQSDGSHHYMPETKLDFLCSLDLIPSVLVKNCPNATKQWLQNASSTPNYDINTTGINSKFSDEQYHNKIDFVNIDDLSTTMWNRDVSSLSSSDNIKSPTTKLNQSFYPLKHVSHENITIVSNTNTVLATSPTLPHQNITEVGNSSLLMSFPEGFDHKDQNNTAQNSCFIKTQSYPTKFPLKLDINSVCTCQNVCISNLSKVSLKDAQMTDLHVLVMKEIYSQQINQTIFAKASIGKTQGYLSELLNKNKHYSSSETLSRANVNIEKIMKFFKKSKTERKRIYEACMSGDVKSLVKRKQHRTVLSHETKKILTEYFFQKNGKLNQQDIQYIATKLQISFSVAKTFYKNKRQRNKKSM